MSISLPVLAALILIGIVAGGVYVVGLTKRWGILVPFSGMLLFGSMTLPLSWNDRIKPTFWLPLQQSRSTLFLACGVAGLVVIVFQLHRLRFKAISLSVWTLVMIGFYAALLRFVHGSPIEGANSVVFSICTLIPLALVAPLALDDLDDFPLILRAIACTNILWIAMVGVQVLVNPKYITMGNEFRFVGLMANPQHTGVLMAFWSVIAVWLLLNDQKKYKIFFLGLAGVNTLLLLWTGSRTGLGMAMIGMSAVLYTRAGRAILFLPLAAIVTYIGFKVMVNVMGVDFGFGRMTSTANTRSSAWMNLVRIGTNNPMFGAGTQGAEDSENSWLYGFASYGIGMLGLLLTMTLIATVESLRSVKLRFALESRHRPVIDLTLGIVAMYFAGAILEGYMISRVSATLCLYPVIAGAGAIFRKHITRSSDPYYDDSYYEGEYVDYSDAPE